MVSLTPISAFGGKLQQIGAGEGVLVSERIGLGLATIMPGRDRAAFDARMQAEFGLTLADEPARVIANDLSFIGTAPGSWLAVGTGGVTVASSLAQRLAGAAHVADQSGGYGVLRLSGPKVREVLAKGLAIDLDPHAFEADRAVVSQIAHLGVTLWQVDDDPPGYDLVLARSSAGSFVSWLRSSAHEVGLRVR